ncbi:MAG: polyprenol monophosphomannose synthase [Candidatus Caldarchaeum sp.]
MRGKARVFVVVPTYNEAENIETLLEKILSIQDLWVIVVDDGSPDGTSSIVEEISKKDSRVLLINRGRKMGLGSAYQDGFKNALENEADVVVSMDADGSHPAELIPELVKAVEQGADVAVASRYVEGGKWSAGFGRMMVSRGANFLAKLCTGVKMRDMTSGFRAYSATSLKNLLTKDFEKGYVFQAETIYRLSRKGFKIVEIPFFFQKRISGKSKLSVREIVRFVAWCFKVLLSRLSGR